MHRSALFFCALLILRPLVAQAQAPIDLDGARDLHRAGAWEEAVAAYRAVAQSATDPATMAVAHNNACVLLVELGDAASATAECEEALRLRRTQDDPRRLGRTLNNYGRALQQKGRFEGAATAFQEALELNRARGDVEAQLINLSNLGLLKTTAGHYGEALRLLHEAEQLAAEHKDQPFAGHQSAIVRINRGVVLEKLGALREALDLYDEILDDTQDVDVRQLAVVEVNRGVMLRQLGDPVSALAAFQKAASSLADLGDDAAQANAHLNAALALHLNLGRLEEAQTAYSEALRLAREAGDRGEEIQTLFYSGRFALDQERFEEAETLFRECAKISAEIGSAEGGWSALEGLGRTAERRGDLDTAAESLLEAIRQIEEVRSGVRHRDLRSGYFGDKRAVFAAAIRVLEKLGRAREAFALVQRAKARELAEILGEKAGETTPFAPDEAMIFDDGSVGLELFIGEENLFAWVVAEGHVRGLHLGPAAPLVNATLRTVRAVSRGEATSPEDLQILAQALLVQSEILDEKAERLWIAPDGVFFHLPFEMLPVGTGVLVDTRIVSYLPSLSMRARLRPQEGPTEGLPEESDLVFAGIGASALPSGRPSGLSRVDPASPASLWLSRFHLEPLPRAEAELRRAAEILGGTRRIVVREKATEAAFGELVGPASRVLHVAAHAVVDDTLGGGAAILLTPGTSASGASMDDTDGLLLPREIAALEVRTRLTILAACNSSLAVGEGASSGLASLSGAFLAAGSPAVIATLWQVDDAAAEIFMEQFYFELERGLPPARALQRVKQRMRADPHWDRPELWAPWVLIGDGPAVVGRSVSWKVLLLGGLLGLAGVLGVLGVIAGIRRNSRLPQT